MIRWPLALSAILLALAAGPRAQGQVIKQVPGRPGVTVPVQGVAATPGAPAPAIDNEPSVYNIVLAVAAGHPVRTALNLVQPFTQAIEASPRMQRLKTLTFDRRPGAILSAWAPKPKDKTSPDQES